MTPVDPCSQCSISYPKNIQALSSRSRAPLQASLGTALRRLLARCDEINLARCLLSASRPVRWRRTLSTQKLEVASPMSPSARALRTIRRILAILAANGWVVSLPRWVVAVVAFSGRIVSAGCRRKTLIAIRGRSIGGGRRRLVAISRWWISVVAVAGRIVDVGCGIAVTAVLPPPIANFLNSCCGHPRAISIGQTD
jgi:hypothetical protein